MAVASEGQPRNDVISQPLPTLAFRHLNVGLCDRSPGSSSRSPSNLGWSRESIVVCRLADAGFDRERSRDATLFRGNNRFEMIPADRRIFYRRYGWLDRVRQRRSGPGPVANDLVDRTLDRLDPDLEALSAPRRPARCGCRPCVCGLTQQACSVSTIRSWTMATRWTRLSRATSWIATISAGCAPW